METGPTLLNVGFVMDTAQIIVTVAGVLLIAAVLAFFFGPGVK
jgi:hypothetical protein